MKIAVVSDIHGNNIAFKAVLEDIEKFNVEGVIIAGDNIGDGPNPGEVVDKISSMKAWVVKGNKEEKVLGYHYGNFPEWKNYKQVAVCVWMSEMLSEEQCKYLSNLPEQIVINIPGTDEIRVVHGSPFDVNEGLNPDVNIDRVKKCANHIKEKVLICGHTHQHFIMKVDDKLIINPGSVGLPINKKAQAEYIILEWSENKWVPHHRFVQYDKDKLISDLESSGLYKYARVWIKVVLYSITTGNEGAAGFIKFAYSLARERGFKGSLIPNDVWFEVEEKWDWDKWMPL